MAENKQLIALLAESSLLLPVYSWHDQRPSHSVILSANSLFLIVVQMLRSPVPGSSAPARRRSQVHSLCSALPSLGQSSTVQQGLFTPKKPPLFQSEAQCDMEVTQSTRNLTCVLGCLFTFTR